jgi:prepilin-type N-terminal cleavage/methylation domain-containing protein/prepilin-type processing-associated H-X9-DG protein
MDRRRGFTLIELLVVIAIIAILAAMLFPVFARARESARKIQCLSNVKNIAMAVQIYLTDYDRFPPKEHDTDVRQYFTDACGCSSGADCWGTQINPYLRWPVVLEEYIKNRDVWRCPSARFVHTFGVNWGYGTGKWWKYAQDTWLGGATGGTTVEPCSGPFPPGWGGSVTDSVKQNQLAGPATGGFDWSVSYPWTLTDMKTGEMSDPVKYVVAADAGAEVQQLDRTSWVAYPDTCRIDCVACNLTRPADWANCPDSQSCGAGRGVYQFATDPQYRKDHAKSRHLGGSNLGFADGHAAWMSSETILFGGTNGSGYAADPNNPLLLDLTVCITPVKKY